MRAPSVCSPSARRAASTVVSVVRICFFVPSTVRFSIRAYRTVTVSPSERGASTAG